MARIRLAEYLIGKVMALSNKYNSKKVIDIFNESIIGPIKRAAAPFH